MVKTSKDLPDKAAADRSHQFNLAVVTTVQLLIARAAPVLITFFICAAVVLTARALAGKTTMADIMFRSFAELKGFKGLAFLSSTGFGGGGILYGVRQRKLRNDVEIKKRSRRATQMSFDPSKFLGKSDENS